MTDKINALKIKLSELPCTKNFSSADKQEIEALATSVYEEAVARVIKIHDLEVSLFRLKQLEDIIKNPIGNAAEIRAARVEKDTLLKAVVKPLGVPMHIFAASSVENAKILSDLTAKLQSGKLQLS